MKAAILTVVDDRGIVDSEPSEPGLLILDLHGGKLTVTVSR